MVYDLTLEQAVEKAKEGYFVTNEYFDIDESMHYYKGHLYYEDGPKVTIELLKSQKWTKRVKWGLKFDPSRVDQEKLQELHERRLVLLPGSNKTYEDCIIFRRENKNGN